MNGQGINSCIDEIDHISEQNLSRPKKFDKINTFKMDIFISKPKLTYIQLGELKRDHQS